MQDSQGFIWFATDAGVCRYDGKNFKTFTPQEGLSDNEIFQLLEDSKGRIWFLPFNGRVSYYEDGGFHNTSTDPSLHSMKADGLYSCVYEDSKHRLWLGTMNDGIILRKSDGTVLKLELTQGPVLHVWQDNNDVVAIASNGIFRFDLNNPEKYAYKPLSNFSHTIDASRKYWVDKGSHRIYCPDRFKGVYIVDYKNNLATHTLKEISPMGIRILSTGQKYVYYHKGAFQWEPDELKTLTDTILTKSAISYLLEDKEGGLWYTTLGEGVYYTPSIDIKRILHAKDGQSQAISNVTGDSNDVWIIYPDGHYSMIQRNNFLIKNFAPIFSPGNRVEQMQINDGAAWIAINSGGLMKIHNDKRSAYFYSLSIKSFSMKGDSLLVSAGPAGLGQYSFRSLQSAASYKTFTKDHLIISERSFGVFADRRRPRIWLGTQQGLAIYENNTTSNLSHLHPYLDNRISKIDQDNEANTWALIEATGLVMLNKAIEVAHVIDKHSGLGDAYCKQFFIDKDNTVWFITHNSLGHIIKENGELSIRSVLYFHTAILNDVWIDDDHIWIASDEGLIIIPKNFRPPQETNVKLTGIFINEKQLNASKQKPLRVSYDSNNIMITFSSISFVTRGEEYRFKIYEKDTAWTYTTSTELKFPSLPPGNYNFQVQIKNPNGLWSTQTAGVPIIIEKPLWQRWWFQVVILILGVGIVTLVIRFIYRANYKKIVLHDKLLESELKALTAQMNPHFISNTLNTVQRYFMTSETKVANKLLSRFSTLMRMTLDNTTKSFISIDEEVTFLKNYLEIEQTRFNHKFGYHIHVDESIDVIMQTIPSMIVQPFVENSIIHGFGPQQENYLVAIGFERHHDHLKIVIDDNGVGRKNSSTKQHTSRGTDLIRERLSILGARNKANYRLLIIDKNDGEQGTRVELYL